MNQYWIYTILLHINLTAYAQDLDFRFDRIGMKDGLPNMTIDALLQDSHGFIWVGTWAGLCRYDGREFLVFTSDRNDSASISSNEIKDMVETIDGRIWIAGYGSQSIYNPELNKFQPWGPSLGSSLYTDKDGMLYFLGPTSNSFFKAIYSLDRDYTKENFLKLQKIPLNLNYELYNERLNINLHPRMDRLGDQLWIATVAGLRIMDLQTEQLLDISKIYPELNNFQEAFLTEIKVDNYGRVWLGTRNELFEFHPQNRGLRKYALGKESESVIVNAIAEGSNGSIWVGTSNGLYFLLNHADNFIVYRHNPDDPFSLSHNEIRSLMVDNNNNLWVGTARGGLNKTYLNTKPTFQALNHTHFGFRNHELVVFAFEASGKEHIWVGTNQGLFLLNKESKKIIRRYTKGDADTLGLAAETVLSIYETQDQKVYLGTRPGGLNILDFKKNKITYVETQNQRNSNKLAGNFFRSIKPAMLGEDSLWLAGPGGINLIIRNEPERYKSLGLNRYYWDVKQLDSCTIEVFGQGKYIYDICDNTFLLRGFWPNRAEGKGIFGKSALLCSLKDKNGNIWMGSYDKGLLRWNEKTESVKTWDIQTGFPSNTVFGILEDSIGNIWCSTANGLVMWDQFTERFLIFTQKDGLMNNEFSTNSFFQAEDGEMYFGGNNGFVSFYPDQVAKNLSSFKPPLQITDIKLSGESLNVKSAPYLLKQVKFTAYRMQHLEFSFAALDFKQADNILYQYKLEGWDREWSKADSRNYAHYTNLSPGIYYFKLRSTNSDRVWQTHELHIMIEVIPLWFQIWWVRIGGLILFLGILGWGFYNYLERLRKREKTKLEYRLSRARHQALAAQMNHHFTFNSLNSIQRFILENNAQSAFLYISQFGKLIRRFLNQAEEDYLSIEEEITTLELYLSLESLRCKHRFHYEFNIDPNIDIFNTDIPTNLIQPFIENAIWHGLIPLKNEDGKLRIIISQEEGKMLISIEDNGIGRDLAKSRKLESGERHISKGMFIVSERIDVLNMRNEQKIEMIIQDLKDDKGNAAGTRVNLYIPFI